KTGAAWSTMCLRSESESFRHSDQRNRMIWCKTLEPSMVRGTGGICARLTSAGALVDMKILGEHFSGDHFPMLCAVVPMENGGEKDVVGKACDGIRYAVRRHR